MSLTSAYGIVALLVGFGSVRVGAHHQASPGRRQGRPAVFPTPVSDLMTGCDLLMPWPSSAAAHVHIERRRLRTLARVHDRARAKPVPVLSGPTTPPLALTSFAHAHPQFPHEYAKKP